MADTRAVVFAPYGIDPETQTAYPAHPTQEAIRAWCREVRQGRHAEHGTPALYLQHGVNSGGTRGILTPLIEYAFEQPGLRTLIGRYTYADLRLSAMETFFTMVPPELIVDQDIQEHRYTLQAKGGVSQVFFGPLKKLLSKGSQEYAVIAVVEALELTLGMYRTLKRRCRQGPLAAFLLMEGNPPTEGHWLTQLTDPKHPDYDASLQKMVLTSRENWPYMTAAYRKDLEALPPMWFNRYVMAEVGGLPDGTPVYPSFIERVHVRETHLIPDRPVLRCWDFGFRATACGWAQHDDDGRVYVHREWCPREIPETTFIDGVIARTNQWFGDRACKDYGDPAASHRDPHGIATHTRLREQRIHLVSRPSTFGQRIPLINRKLIEMVRGEPAIVVSPHCRTLIQGLSGGYHYPTLQEGQALTDRRDLPFHDPVFSHIVNAFEYLMINLFGGAPGNVVQRHQAAYRRQLANRQLAHGATAVF